MNSTLPTPQPATVFKNSKARLRALAIGLGLYSLLVLYPAYVGLHYIYADTLPSAMQVLSVTILAGLFAWFANRQMTQLSPPNTATQSPRAES